MASSNSRSATKGTSAKRASTKKASTTSKTSSSRSSAKPGPSSKSSDPAAESNGARSSAPRAEPRPAARAAQVAAEAANELVELTGKGVEGVTGLERTDDGWTVQVEVVEVRRIPDTTDVLALYEVKTDKHGSLLGYRRLRRYARGVPGND
jgi:hypothetical protein